jgi:hypothetical protein
MAAHVPSLTISGAGGGAGGGETLGVSGGGGESIGRPRASSVSGHGGEKPAIASHVATHSHGAHAEDPQAAASDSIMSQFGRQRRNPVYLRMGGEVTLMSEEEQEDGYLSFGASGAVTDLSLVKTQLDADCVFTLEPMTQCSARKALKRARSRGEWIDIPKAAAGGGIEADRAGRGGGPLSDGNAPVTAGGTSTTTAMSLGSFNARGKEYEPGSEMQNLNEYVLIEQASNRLVRQQLQVCSSALLLRRVLSLTHFTGQSPSVRTDHSPGAQSHWSVSFGKRPWRACRGRGQSEEWTRSHAEQHELCPASPRHRTLSNPGKAHSRSGSFAQPSSA